MPKPTSRTDQGTPSSVWLKILDRTASASVPPAGLSAAASADPGPPKPTADPEQQSSVVAAAAGGKRFEPRQRGWTEKGGSDKNPRPGNKLGRRSSTRNSNRSSDS